MKRLLCLLTILVLAFSVAGCSSSDKPSKQKVIDGMLASTEDPTDAEEAFVECIVNDVYDDVSTKTLKYLSDSDNQGDSDNEVRDEIGKKDFKTLNDALEKCSDDRDSEEEDSESEDQTDDSNALTRLRNGTTSVKSLQTANGTVGFDGITSETLTDEDPDVSWVEGSLGFDESDMIGVLIASAEKIILQTRDEATCYYIELNDDEATRYAHAHDVGADTCPETDDVEFAVNQQEGWHPNDIHD